MVSKRLIGMRCVCSWWPKSATRKQYLPSPLSGLISAGDKIVDLRHWAFEPDKQDPVTSLGIQPRSAQIDTVLAEVRAGSAAQKAGLQAGDRIVKVDGQPLTQWMTFVNLVRDNPGKALALEIERQGSALPLTLTPDAKR